MRKLIFLLLAISSFYQASSQEINCKIKIMSDRIQNVDKQIFTNIESNIRDFINQRKWTNDEFQAEERIDMNILINLLTKTEDDIYSATFSIQTSRPVYNTSYTSPLVNHVDKDVVFKLNQFTQILFDENRISGNDAMTSNLSALIAYYVYISLGLDYDSYKLNGGTVYYNKALNIVNNAPEEGKSISGWKAIEGTKNRYWIIDQLLNPRFAGLRSYLYTYHREGFDQFSTKPEEAKTKILSGIPTLGLIQRENPGAFLLHFFFNAKSDELTKLLALIPQDKRGTYINLLMQMDVTNANKYNNLK
jgi:hypothetical protein